MARQDFNKGTSSGTLYGTLNNGFKPTLAIDAVLNDLNDVSIENPKKDDILYNNGSMWVNGPVENIVNGCKIWVLNGGNAFGHDCEPEPPVPEFDSYADETIEVLDKLINSVEFQQKAALVSGLDAINMNGKTSTINLVVSGKFSGILDYVYKDNKVSEMMGRIISSIYNNINYGNIRHSMDELETDMWINFDNAKNEDLMEEKVFIYYEDESYGFLKFRIRFVK